MSLEHVIKKEIVRYEDIRTDLNQELRTAIKLQYASEVLFLNEKIRFVDGFLVRLSVIFDEAKKQNQ